MSVPKIDLHCDISFCVLNGKADLFKPIDSISTGEYWDDEEIVNQISVPDADKVSLQTVFGVIFPFDENMDKEKLIEEYKIQNSFYDSFIDDLNERDNKLEVVKHIEGLYFLDSGNYLHFLDEFYENNIKSLGIMWNKDNAIGCGNATEDDTGLTEFGKEVVQKMAEMGFVIDLAHTSYRTFFDVLEIVPENYPLMCSHANVYAVNPHSRNLKDEQIKALIDRDGVLGLSFVKSFVGGGRIDDWYRHFEYVLSNFSDGYKVLALGSDFDGIFKVSTMDELEKVSDLEKLEEFLAKKVDRDIVERFFYKNAQKIIGKL